MPATSLRTILAADPRLAAAWDAVGNPARGGSGWDRVAEKMADPDLPTDHYAADSPKLAKLVKRLAQKNVDTGETLVFKYFAEGPCVAIVLPGGRRCRRRSLRRVGSRPSRRDGRR